MSTDYLIIKKYFPNVKVCFINPMLSTYHNNGVKECLPSYYFKNDSLDRLKKPKVKLSFKFEDLKIIFLKYLIYYRYTKIIHDAAFQLSDNNEFTLLFKDVFEISLAPAELEVKECKDIHYWGLAISDNRLSNLQMKKAKNSNFRKIYCSFGTYFEDFLDEQILLLNNLIRIVNEDKTLRLVCSLNEKLINQCSNFQNNSNIILKKNNINQLNELINTDLFICHGGLGSVKEAIYCSVPLLIFPLDMRYDQVGNAVRVRHHNLGVVGNIQNLSYDDLREKLYTVLNNNEYQSNIDNLRLQCNTKYNERYKQEIIESLIKI